MKSACKAKTEAKKKIRSAERSRRLAWGSLLMTLALCLVGYPAFLRDAGAFICVPAVTAWGWLIEYSNWFEKPFYLIIEDGIEMYRDFSPALAWSLRILTIAVILAIISGLWYGAYRIGAYYRKRWCSLSLKVLLASFAAVVVLGDAIKSCIGVNLFLFLIVSQILYLGVLAYLDTFFESRNQTARWKRIQKT